MSTATEKRPAHSLRHRTPGRSLECALWENQGKNQGTYYTCTLSRSWKDDGTDTWTDISARFGASDLLPAAQLLYWADNEVGVAIAANAKADETKRPVASKSRGLLEVAVWHKVTEDGDRYNVSLKRKYEHEGKRKEEIIRLQADQLLPAARLLSRSFDAIDQLYAEGSSNFVAKAREDFGGSSVDDDSDIPF